MDMDFDDEANGDSRILYKMSKSPHWILDLDLTFFAVLDKFKDLLKSPSADYRIFKSVYAPKMKNLDENSVLNEMSIRENNMDALEMYSEELLDGDAPTGSKIADLAKMIVTHKMDFNTVHWSGRRLIGICEPHHRSTKFEIEYLAACFADLVMGLKTNPIMISLSKSQDHFPIECSASVVRLVSRCFNDLYSDYRPYCMTNTMFTANH
ncbi:hypothetical protein ACOME3_009655 [Neoechinorhynchus agilis]